MKIIVENEAFARALEQVKGCIKPSTIPILGHVALEAHAETRTLVVRANNIAREAEASLPAEVITSGASALPGEVLVGLVRRLAKGGQCAVDIADGRAHVVSGSSKYNLPVLSVDDFPSRKKLADNAVAFGVSASLLREMLAAVIYAADANSARFFCQGVHLHLSGPKLVVVATDEHRFALRSTPFPKGAAGMPSVIVPVDAARAIIGLLDGVDDEAEDVELAVSTTAIEVRLPGVRLASALVDAQFPPYEQVKFVPERGPMAASFRPYVLAEAVDRANIVNLGSPDAKKRPPSVKLRTDDGAIHLSAGLEKQATEIVEAETNGHDIEFFVVASYLTDMLKAWPEDVVVEMQQAGPMKPVMFSVEGRPNERHLVMPTRN